MNVSPEVGLHGGKKPEERNLFTITPKAGASEILIFGDVGESWSESSVSARDFMDELQAIDSPELSVRINSVGGSVPDGLAIFNALRRHPAKVTVHIDGMALSIASLIAMAGDHVVMAENALLMVHAPWAGVIGNAEELREMAGTLDRWADSMATSYASKTGKGIEHARALLTGKDHYFSAAEALSEGFIDEILEPVAIAASARIPPDAAARFIDLKNLSEQQTEEFLMPQQQAQNPNTPTAAQREQARRDGITAHFTGSIMAHQGMFELREKLLADPKMTPEAAGHKILAKMAEGVEPVAGHYFVDTDRMAFGASGRDRAIEDMSAAILARAGLADKDTMQVAARANVRNHKLIDFARGSLERAGIQHGHMDPMALVGAALTQTSSDFPVILENAMHKAMLNAYNTFPDTWARFCHVGSVSDFRAHGRYRTGSIGNYIKVNEAGEFQHVNIPDGEKASIQVDTSGAIIALTRKMIVNDDLGAFLNIAADLGRSGRRTVEAAVYALMAENAGLGPVLGDGKTLFHADHKNIGTGSALGVAGIEADRVLLGSQKDVSGNDFLYLRPDVLLVAMELGGTARVINDSQYDPDAATKLQKPNMVRGLFSDVVDTPRLTGTRRYLFASPTQSPVIEVAFLNGEREPFVEQMQAFTVDGTMYRARLDFGVAAIDYRGAVTNAGAA